MARDTVVVRQPKSDKHRVDTDTNILRVVLFTVARLSSAPIKLLILKTLSRVLGHTIGQLATGEPTKTIANGSNL
jgi:hypothetical protein